jgi:hypothetical protein
MGIDYIKIMEKQIYTCSCCGRKTETIWATIKEDNTYDLDTALCSDCDIDSDVLIK